MRFLFINMNTAYLLLGSNSGNREEELFTAKQLIEEELGEVTRFSALYETAPWGFQCQEYFFNMAIELQTSLQPHHLMHKILQIEFRLGRLRFPDKQWVSRTIDIDILFYNDLILNDDTLTIPHKLLQERKFALVPLNEIAPDLLHPVFMKKISKLLAECKDELQVKLFKTL